MPPPITTASAVRSKSVAPRREHEVYRGPRARKSFSAHSGAPKSRIPDPTEHHAVRAPSKVRVRSNSGPFSRLHAIALRVARVMRSTPSVRSHHPPPAVPPLPPVRRRRSTSDCTTSSWSRGRPLHDGRSHAGHAHLFDRSTYSGRGSRRPGGQRASARVHRLAPRSALSSPTRPRRQSVRISGSSTRRISPSASTQISSRCSRLPFSQTRRR